MTKRVNVNPAAVGAFAAGALALAIAGLFVFGGASKLFIRKFPVIMYFEENVTGLAVGAQVAYRGIKLGTVTGIHSVVGSSRIAVAAKLERGPFMTPEHAGQWTSAEQMERALEEAVKQGMRAQLALQSFLTGQLYVSLILRPDIPASFARLDPKVVEIPTIPTIWSQLEAGLQQVPLVNVPKYLYLTLEGTARLLQDPTLAKTLESAGPLVADVQTLVKRVDREVGPLLVSVRNTSDAARGTLKDVQRQLDLVVADLQPKASGLIISLTDTSNTARGTLDSARFTLTDVQRQLDLVVADLQPKASGLITSLTETSDTARGTVKDLRGDLQRTLDQLKPLVAKLELLSDSLRGTAETANVTLVNLDGTLNASSPLGYQLTQTLKEFAAAAQNLQALTDQLERNPESLLRGKGGRPGGK